MKDIFIISDSIISPLGFSTSENYSAIRSGKSGIKMLPSPTPPFDNAYLAIIDDDLLQEKFYPLGDIEKFTKVEKLLLTSITSTLKKSNIKSSNEDLLIIISTTKGNIDLLEHSKKDNFPADRVHLWSLTNTIQSYFNTKHKPIIVSNACISGVNAMVLASRLLRDGVYKHVLVAGVDIVTPFVYSGFQSFKAISSSFCKPFDSERDGINLGEACGTILLSINPIENNSVKLLGGSISNDANHISGPSRTGDGLTKSIINALKESTISSASIDLLNAHGTATVYNDEMEAKAFKTMGLQNTPMNSLKGYFGHTLGAAGVIETIISVQAMINGEILPTLGYTSKGTTEEVGVSAIIRKKNIKYLLKTASGFGGCNGAIVLENYESK